MEKRDVYSRGSRDEVQLSMVAEQIPLASREIFFFKERQANIYMLEFRANMF